MKQNCSPFSSTDGWRLNQDNTATWLFSNNGEAVKVEILSSSDSEATVLVNSEQNIRISFEPSNLPTANLYKPEEALNYYASSDTLTAPMPGKIIALNCAVGDTVSEGAPLVVMEAMKMEQTLTAPRDGIIAEIGAAVGELVSDGALLVRLEE